MLLLAHEDLAKTDINKVLKDILAGKTRVSVKTKKLRGKVIVRGGAGTATCSVGLLGGILTYAVEAGIIVSNPAHGVRKPKDNVRKRRRLARFLKRVSCVEPEAIEEARRLAASVIAPGPRYSPSVGYCCRESIRRSLAA